MRRVAGNPLINTVLPESGTGFRTYNREEGGTDQYGLASTIDFFVDLGEEWAVGHEVPFQVGDISRRGGGAFPPHQGHRNGNEADVRPFRREGEMLPTNIFDLAYDQAATREFVELVRERAPRAIVLFNDPQLMDEGLTRFSEGHYDHLHVRLPLPQGEEEPPTC
ncbi:MAG: hypothetical protein AB1758_22840 [Candidatus Eremiobacterota bacterium]